MGDGGGPAGSARLHLADGLALLRPEEQVFTAMLDGWRAQQLARNLAFSTVDGRVKAVEAFTRHAGGFPWQWSPAAVDEWFADLRAVRHLKHSTLRSYQEALRGFCSYVTDPAYDWPTACEQRFGTHPVQVVHEWNTAAHVQAEGEGDPTRRAFTRAELEALFDHADEQVSHPGAGQRMQGLAARVPRLHPVQGRLRLRAAPPRGADARTRCAGARRRRSAPSAAARSSTRRRAPRRVAARASPGRRWSRRPPTLRGSRRRGRPGCRSASRSCPS